MPDLIRDHTWRTIDHPRVLIEAAEWRKREQIAAVLRGEGYDTVACAGPEGSGHRCSLAAGDGCRAAQEADVVVHALGSYDLRNVEALHALRRRLPATPVVVEIPAAEAARRRDELTGYVVVEPSCSASELAAAVTQALEGPTPDA